MSGVAPAGPRVLAVAALSLIALACCGVQATVADAQFALTDFDGEVLAEDGSAASQAGSHPFTASTTFDLATEPDPVLGSPFPRGGSLRDVTVDLPPGVVGNPAAAELCTEPGLNEAGHGWGCPPGSQVGTVTIRHSLVPEGIEESLFNMVPPPGVAATLGFVVSNVPVHLNAFVRVRADGSYGVSVETVDTAQPLVIIGTTVTVWGVPANPVHDPQRVACVRFPDDPCGLDQASARAFFTNPTACPPPGVGLESRMRTVSWLGESDEASFLSHRPAPDEDEQLGPTGCDAVPFDPSVSVSPTASSADAATGLKFDLSLDQHGLTAPDGLAPAHLKRARVTLPEGMTINPAAADGLQACSDAQLGLGSDDPVDCPDAARVGTVTARSPLLARLDADNQPVLDENGEPALEKVAGGVYIRSQNSSDPASGEMFRLALVLENEDRGIRVKLAGQVRADRQTGRLVTTFDNNPQLPVESIDLALDGGPRAPLALPPTCGTKTIDTQLVSWSGQTREIASDFTIPCSTGAGFAPRFDAGTVSPTGGAFSPFAARIERPEGQRFLSGVAIDMPRGLLAKLRGVQLCPDAVAGDGTPGVCPAGSRIGTATVGAGSGNPFFLRGDVYLTGPYGSGPYGLSVQAPAKAGPFDLGMVKVRQALYVDPVTAQVSVVSDPLPQIVKGVPVRLRSVNVDVDRPGFTINPTSCVAKSVDATLTSVDGAVHKTSSRFQASDCQALAFKPRLAMRLVGKGRTRTGAHPALKSVLTQAKGQANIGKAQVTLPRSVVLDANNSADPKLLCGYDEALKADCPASSIVGKATAYTPVLNRPLNGNVHLVQGIKFGPKGNRIRTTPALLVKLRGEVAIDLRAKTRVDKSQRLVTTFPAVPDAPVSKFSLQINGGKKGILVVTRTRKSKIDICKSKQTAGVETDGQNGKHADFATRIKTPCAKAKKARAKSRKG